MKNRKNTEICQKSSGPALLEYGNVEQLPEVMKVMEASFASIYGESWNEQQCRTMLLLKGTHLLIARINSDICGFAISRMVLDEEELLMIAVSPDYRGQKIGRQLLDQIIQRSTQDQATAIFLEVRSSNDAQNLYKDIGFEQIGTRKAYYTGSTKIKYDANTYKKLLLNNN